MSLKNPINIPKSLSQIQTTDNEYPMKVEIELMSNKEISEFDIDLIIDTALN